MPRRRAIRRPTPDFVAKVLDFKSRFDSNAAGMSVDVMSFLSNWLQNHIKGEDKKYAPLFNANGLK